MTNIPIRLALLALITIPVTAIADPILGSLEFQGSAQNQSTASRGGDSNERDWGSGISLSSPSTTQIKGKITAQASADATLYGDSKADYSVLFTVPYRVSRIIQFIPDPLTGLIQVVVPQLVLQVQANWAGYADTDGSADASVSNAQVASTGGVFSSFQLDGPGFFAEFFSDSDQVSTSLGSGTSVGEVSLQSDIPGDFSIWVDDDAPFADYLSSGGILTQILDDALSISFNLDARSDGYGGCIFCLPPRPPVRGGEALACLGRDSGLSFFGLDDLRFRIDTSFYYYPCDESPDGDSHGLFFSLALSQTGSDSFLVGTEAESVPEPTSLALLGLGLIAMLLARRKGIS